MSVDLNARVGQNLTLVQGELAATLGLDAARLRRLLAAAAPATLATMEMLVSTPEGARTLSQAINEADPGATRAGSRASLNASAERLAGLLGPVAFETLSETLARHVAAPAETIRPALGAVGRAILTALRDRAPPSGDAPAEIANYFASESAAIAAALPADLAAAPEDAGPVATLQAAAAASAKLGPAPSAPAQLGPRSGRRGADVTPWLILLVAILIAAGIAYYQAMNMRPKLASSFMQAAPFVAAAPHFASVV